MKKIILTQLVISLLFFSCKKKEETQTPPTPLGTAALHLHTNINNNEVDSGMIASDDLGRKIKLNIAQFYISNVTLKQSNGSTVALTGMYLLKNIQQEEYVLGQIPTGNYSSISFNVGIDAATNATLPASHTGILAAQTPPMWFGSALQGYIFMNIEGASDSTGTGSYFRSFAYQIGTNVLYQHVTLTYNTASPLVITSQGTSLIHVTCDYGYLLKNVSSFKTQNAVATPFNSDSVLIKQIANNIPAMFRFE
ncbi:MAG: hypothetical protein JST67_02025 [Bacteroidetes bacterium]|nr:hypothetical protein [Bacteroidota bacterium]